MPRLQISLVLSAIALLIQPLVLAQAATILPSTLPACAAQCTTLTNAQGSCEANPAAAGPCFCQSALLVGLKTSSTAICPNCDAADLGTIAAWYNKFCANGGVDPPPKVVTVTSTTSPAAKAPAATADTAAATTAATVSEGVNKNQSGTAWWKSHWKWVLMVIILAVAFGIIGGVGAIIFKRRKRRLDGANEPRPDMIEWAPASQHNVHDFAGPSPGVFGADGTTAPAHPQPRGAGNGKEREVVAGVVAVPNNNAVDVRSKKRNKIKKALGG